MFSYVWPLALVVISNVFYQICAKEVPTGVNPFASLTVTYAIGAVLSLILFYSLNKNVSLFKEIANTNWASFVMGLTVVGLEVGYIFAYKAGWPVSIAQIIQASVLAVILIFVGSTFYKEPLTWNKIVGIIICLVGLGIINIK